MPWFWTDDLARLLTSNGHANGLTIERWLRHPQAVRGDGDAIAVAETLLADEDDEDHLAA
jgi:hypothetical protein